MYQWSIIPFIILLILYKYKSNIKFIFNICKNTILKRIYPGNKYELINENKIIKIACGEQYIYLPYDDLKSVDMNLIKSHGYTHDDKIYDITQHPGVPYLYSPSQLGLKKIVIYNHANDEEKIYNEEELIEYPTSIL